MKTLTIFQGNESTPSVPDDRPDKDMSAASPDTQGESRRKRRKMQRGERIHRVLEPWTSEFLAQQQLTDPDLLSVRMWVEGEAKPKWEDIRGESPALKTYWQQFESIKIIDGVLYRVLDTPEQDRQLLLPRSLREEFLALVHGGVAGHLGVVKTRAHVGRRAYWFRWRVDTDIY